MNRLPTKEAIEAFLLDNIRPRLKKNPQLKDVVVWVESLNDARGFVTLGMALGSGTGCSPFCGCAANQIAELIEKELCQKFSGIARVFGKAALPAQEYLDQWNKN